MTEYRLLIDGKLVHGDMTMAVVNPATEQVLARAPRASRGQLDTAVAAAKAAFPAWAARPINDRRALILRIADQLEARAEEFARLLTQEHGKPLPEAQAEIIAGAAGGRGPNADYLYNTVAHLAELGIPDDGLAALAARVRALRA